MKGENSAQFHHRVKADGTIDSICPHCFLTAATVENEADLQELEAAHQCPERGPSILVEIARRGRRGEASGV
jgi:hypothetical protein